MQSANTVQAGNVQSAGIVRFVVGVAIAGLVVWLIA